MRLHPQEHADSEVHFNDEDVIMTEDTEAQHEVDRVHILPIDGRSRRSS
jgi:hypothetical protein